MDVVFNIALVGLVIGAFFLALQPRYLFVVRIQGDVAWLAKGKLTRAFLEEIDLVCRETPMARVWIGGVRRGGRVVLVFSRGIPSPCKQRLRNLWMMHR
jgi:hypothetical protein